MQNHILGGKGHFYNALFSVLLSLHWLRRVKVKVLTRIISTAALRRCKQLKWKRLHLAKLYCILSDNLWQSWQSWRSIQEFKYSYVQKHIVLFSATSWQLKNTLYNWLAYTFNMLNGLTTVRTAIKNIFFAFFSLKLKKGTQDIKRGPKWDQIPKRSPRGP